ncbi:hypothetical protein ACFLXC_02675 [Chloroflexota bacterium]
MGVSIAQWATYIAYVFVIVAYAWKVQKVVRKPLHLRWELYPVLHEKAHKYGGSYFEELDWWTKPRKKSYFISAFHMLKNYLLFGEYFRKKRNYWVSLYPWHLGFYLIVFFHVMAFIGAVVIVTTEIEISAQSANAGGLLIFYLTLIVAVASFILGAIGSIGMLITRLADRDLRNFAVPVNFFNYLFFLIVFLSGLFAWALYDTGLGGYREFWTGLITYKYVHTAAAEYTHIMLFSVFLIYLPFTRSTHYITKIIAFFGIRSDDTPNIKGSGMADKINKLLDQKVSWSASHIRQGKSWKEQVSGLPGDESKAEAK